MKKLALKILRIIPLLLGIYFALGVIASISLIIVEATTSKMSIEIKQSTPNFSTKIIYIGLSVFTIVCAGFSFVCFFGRYAIKKASKF